MTQKEKYFQFQHSFYFWKLQSTFFMFLLTFFFYFCLQADSMKHEAGGVLGEVKRKQTDAIKAVELLKALRKLREARKQEAEVKGNNFLM